MTVRDAKSALECWRGEQKRGVAAGGRNRIENLGGGLGEARCGITPPVRASAPPESPVPTPRPTMGTLYFAASFAMHKTSSVEWGKTTSSGRPFSTERSYLYRRRSSGR